MALFSRAHFEKIHPDRPFLVSRIHKDDVVRSARRDPPENVVVQIAVGVDQAHAFPTVDIVEDHPREARALAGASLAADIDVLLAVGLGDSEVLGRVLVADAAQ